MRTTVSVGSDGKGCRSLVDVNPVDSYSAWAETFPRGDPEFDLGGSGFAGPVEYGGDQSSSNADAAMCWCGPHRAEPHDGRVERRPERADDADHLVVHEREEDRRVVSAGGVGRALRPVSGWRCSLGGVC